MRSHKASVKEIHAARSLYGSDDIEVDGDAKVSRANDGVWVQAWVWVPKENTTEGES
jgi:hypothetical protein